MNEEIYEFSNEHFRIKDTRYDVDISETFSPPLPLIEGTNKVLFATHDICRAYIEIYSEKNGSLFEQYGILDKKKHGRYRLFFQTGNVASERWYVGDDLWGRAIDFYSEGGVKKDFGYRQGNLHGPVRVFRETGVPLMKGHYKDGRAQGVFQLFDPQGQLLRTTSFEQGLRKGSDAGFSEDGYMLYLDFWEKGVKKETSFFDCIERYLQNEIAKRPEKK